MLNQVILVGRVNKLDREAGIVSITIKRPNDEEVDLIPVKLNDGLMENILGYLIEGTTIGVKASLNIGNDILRIIGEKITFIEKK